MRYDAVRGFWEEHTAGENLNYGIDYTDLLAENETIDSSLWAAESAVTLTRKSVEGKVAVVYAHCATPDRSFKITNTATTSTGATHVHSILLVCKAP